MVSGITEFHCVLRESSWSSETIKPSQSEDQIIGLVACQRLSSRLKEALAVRVVPKLHSIT